MAISDVEIVRVMPRTSGSGGVRGRRRVGVMASGEAGVDGGCLVYIS